MSRPSRTRIPALFATLLVACGGGAGPEGGAPVPGAASSVAPVRVDTLPGGRVVAENPPPRGSGGWSFEEDLRLGTATDSGPEQFGQIYRVTTDVSGRIYALDYLAQDIRAFDADGTFLHLRIRRP